MKPNIRLKIPIKSVPAWQGEYSKRLISILTICVCSRFIKNAAYWSAANKGSRRRCRINPFPHCCGTCDCTVDVEASLAAIGWLLDGQWMGRIAMAVQGVCFWKAVEGDAI